MTDVVIKWLIGAALAGALTLFGFFQYFGVKAEVEKQLADAGYPSSAVVELMQRDIEANTERAMANKQNADRLDSKIERVVQILLED